jgi:hypothetical protein
MQKNSAFPNSSELKEIYLNKSLIRKGDLRKLFLSKNRNLSEQEFRRVMYSMERNGQIIPIGAGLFGNRLLSNSSDKKKYSPVISTNAENVSLRLLEKFPYSPHVVWETNLLREFMVMQPSHNLIIIETEKDSMESFFNYLKQHSITNVFIDPDQLTFERYISDLPESILVFKKITQAPVINQNVITLARLEKILVDVFSDTERFYAFHGQELINIFENAFSNYWINTKTLFRYAGRRNSSQKIKNFINHQTHINLLQYGGN